MKTPQKKLDHIAPQARNFYLAGNRTGILLIHGFAGSIADLRWFGEQCHGQGYTVAGVRLAGHGTSVRDLHNSTAEDWIASVRSELAALRQHTDQQVLVGESMGALLALRLAREYTGVCGVIALSPALSIEQERVRRLLSTFAPPGRQWKKKWVDDQRAQRGSLRVVTTKSFREFIRLLESERMHLPATNVPVLALFSRSDFLTGDKSLARISASVPKNKLSTRIFETSAHHLGETQDRKHVLKTMIAFIKQHEELPKPS